MVRRFLFVWAIYWVTVALLPVYSIYPSTTQAFLLQLGFVILVAGSLVATLSMFRVHRMPDATRVRIPSAAKLIWISIAVSVLGLAALMYDKLFVQGIDYSEGVSFAREEWRRAGEDREGQVSSVFSLIGYLFGSAYYVAAVLAITQRSTVSLRTRMGGLLSAFALLMANSALTGGRSNILLIGAILIGAFGARRGLSWSSLFARPSHRRLVNLLMLLGVGYTVFIFYQRAAAGEVDALEYAIDFLPFLGLEAANWYRDSLDGGILGSFSAMLVLAVSYVTHSFATVAAIVDAPIEDKTIIFLHAANILYKLGVSARPDGDWFLAGRFPSVPGALWHQFGLIGFVISSLCLGIVCALAMVWTAKSPERLLPLGACVMAEATLLMSPALFAADFLSFPFVLGSFVMFAMLGSMWQRRRPRRVPPSRLSAA